MGFAALNPSYELQVLSRRELQEIQPMSDTVLGFWDFFWIWWIMAILGGGTSYLSSRDNNRLAALDERIAALTEELRNLRRDTERRLKTPSRTQPQRRRAVPLRRAAKPHRA